MTKCPKCKFYSICGGRLNETVENCVRFKSVEQTNEQWFCSLPTDEKAKWIANEINERVKLALHDSELNDGDVDADYYMEDADDWVEWLKQPLTTVKE